MNEIMSGIKVVAFDIDGTLYPNHRLFLRIVGYVARNLRFYMHFNRVRKILHKTAPLPDFYEYQARLLAEELSCPIEHAKEKIQKVVYSGLTPYLEKIEPFSGVEETFRKIKERGLKIALLSDFPPAQKGLTWGLLPYCDLVLGSEESGALKPSKYPFGVLCLKMGVAPGEILYVGNSVKYDVRGSKNAGMKSALIVNPVEEFLRRRLFRKSSGFGTGTDFLFSNYRQFQEFVLE